MYNINSEMQKEAKITMTHIFSKALMMGMAKNRRDFGRIKWGYVIILVINLIVPKSREIRSHSAC